jgi:hypothetical protein
MFYLWLLAEKYRQKKTSLSDRRGLAELGYCNLLLVVLCFAHVRGAVSSSGTVPEKNFKKGKKGKKDSAKAAR